MNDVAGYSPEDEVDFIVRDARRWFLIEELHREFLKKKEFLESGLPEIPSNLLYFNIDF